LGSGGKKKKKDGVPLKGWGVTTANKEWHDERMKMGTIGGDTLIQ